jgi:hypothetical protein
LVAALLAALLAVIAAYPNAVLAGPPEITGQTIDVEAEAGLVGRGVTVKPGAAVSGGEFVSFSGPAPRASDRGVRIAGNRFLRDGAPFVPVGFTMVATVNPMGEGETAFAAQRLSDRDIEAAISWGANTLRFQVSQRGLDPTDGLFSDAYVNRIVDAVALARFRGLVVMLSVQDQGPSGGGSHGQPSAATIRDWETLTGRFNGDPNVMYEIFNEPHSPPTPAGWAVWRNGGPASGNQGTPAVGHQRVLDAIRATGSANVVVADAGQFGQRLDGIPLLHDPLGQVAYGIHPYLTHTLRTPADWQPGFGFLATQYPVVATEWTANSKVKFCHPEWGTTAPQLVSFLQARDIGMLAWAFDVLDSLIVDWRHTPTSLEGFQCGEFDHGAGALLKSRMPEWGPHLSPCETGLSDEGVVALPLDVAHAGTYRLWSRVAGPGVSWFQVDDRCPVPASTGAGQGGAWSWQSGPQLDLGAGLHTLRFFGAAGGVSLDRVVLTTDPGWSSTP